MTDHKCPICGFESVDARGLAGHLRLKHGRQGDGFMPIMEKLTTLIENDVAIMQTVVKGLELQKQSFDELGQTMVELIQVVKEHTHGGA